MTRPTRSDSDAPLIKRGTSSVKTKRKQPFVLESFLSHAEERRTKATYQMNEIIFRQGDLADAVFYIMEGKCKVTVVSEQGKEAVIAVHEKGDFFGEGCLNGQSRRLATVTAITVSEVMRLAKATMVRALHDQPNFSKRFISHLLARNVRVESDLVDQLFNSSEKRLARLLLLMAHFGKEGRPEPVIAKISQEMLAKMIGTTRSRVSFFMNKFRKLGFIDYDGGGDLEVHSSLLNMVLHETPGLTMDSDEGMAGEQI
jgi:CRP/FNR family transcriptional regulator, cyclic AMP receptor protein